MHFRHTLTCHTFFKVGQNIENSNLYLLQGYITHLQRVGGWGWGDLNHHAERAL
jgi:hypothetical protein